MKIINKNRRESECLLDVSPEDLASQITLIDLEIFKSIQRDELFNLGESCGLISGINSKRNIEKRHKIPNIISMNQQFNQITFWVVGQVLHYGSPRLRAECISHLIKTAKGLHQLNNLHSAYAFVSALLSSPIYRLEKTWQQVRKRHPKDKIQFDRLKEFYSDTSNYFQLREHLSSCPLPCIPYLGLYARDIIYINEVFAEGTEQRTNSVAKILNLLEHFQDSNYDNLVSLADITSALKSSRYLDELQKYVEDESYRRSLELEPPETSDHHKNRQHLSQNQHHSLDLTAAEAAALHDSNLNNDSNVILPCIVSTDRHLDRNQNETNNGDFTAKGQKNSASILVNSLSSIFQSASNRFLSNYGATNNPVILRSKSSATTGQLEVQKPLQTKEMYLLDDSPIDLQLNT